MPAVSPLLANAGFYPASTAIPTALTPTPWAHFTNVTGLVAGVTKLGDELSLLYNWGSITNSVFANALAWVWNGSGSQFASSEPAPGDRPQGGRVPPVTALFTIF